MVTEQERPGAPTSRRPPRWLPRALLYTAIAVFAAVAVWRALGQLGSVILILVMSLFLGLAMEPSVAWLARRGWRRGAATGVVMIGGLLGVLAIFLLFGNLFVQQLIELVSTLPGLYDQVAAWVEGQFGVEVPEREDAVSNLLATWGDDVATGILGIGGTIVGALFSLSAILLVTYYFVAAGPKFRAAICGLMPQDRQTEVLRIWEISQQKISDFINSRLVLAFLCTVFTWIFLAIMEIPYALPLAAFTGVVSQFIPTIGTYIGGALPVAVALGQGPGKALAVLAFIIGYQQVENLVFSPKVAAHSMDINPAVSFLSVIAFGAVFGPLGAFLSLPVVASIQAVSATYVRRHELVESQLLQDDRKRAEDEAWKSVPDDDAGADDADADRADRAPRPQA